MEETTYSDYEYPFIDSYINIPKNISDKVDSEFSLEKPSIEYCIALIITNLLKNNEIAYSKDWNYYSKFKDKSRFYSRTNMIKAIDLLESREYLTKTRKGHLNKKFEKGISSRISALPKLKSTYDFKTLGAAKEIDLNLLPTLVIDNKSIYTKKDIKNINIIYPKYISSHLLSNSYTLTRGLVSPCLKIRHRKLKYRTVASLFYEMQTLNDKYFHSIKLDFSNIPNLQHKYMTQVHLTRCFVKSKTDRVVKVTKNGKTVRERITYTYPYDENGRLWQKGSSSYQQLPEADRLKLLINGLEVSELDFSALHPNLLYCFEGKQAGDIYKSVIDLLKVNYPTISKFEVKNTILLAINSRSNRRFSCAINSTSRRKNSTSTKPTLYNELKRKGIPRKAIIDAFEQAHPAIKRHLFSSAANMLMLWESSLMVLILKELMRLDIPALPIHDSLLFPKIYESQVKQVMLDSYKKYTGFDIVVK